MEYKKPQKLSKLLESDPEAFAKKITEMVDDSYEAFRPLRDKCWRNERVWRNKHWDESLARDEEDASKPQPNNPTLYSTVENCVADVMDNYPDQILRGVNHDDDIKASIWTEIIRGILYRAQYKAKYKKKIRAMHKVGTGTLYPYWNPDMANGIGDIDFKYLHIDNIAWDKNASNVNEGRWFAMFDWMEPEDVYEIYPDIDLEECFPENEEGEREKHPNETEDTRESEKEGRIRRITFRWRERESREVSVDGEDTKTRVGMKTYIHSAVVIGNQVVEPHLNQYAYDRFGVEMLPYVELEGEPFGLSLIDMFKDDSDTINFIEQQYLCNLQAAAEGRLLVNYTADIDETALKDHSKKIIRGKVINENAVRELRPDPFSSQALSYKNAKMGEIKEQSGQLDVNIGQSSAGVTAASAIENLQEYGAKRSRLVVDSCFEEHKFTIKDVLALVKVHYKTARIIRISRELQDQVEQLVKKAMQNVQELEMQAQNAGTTVRQEALKSVLPEGVSIVGNEMTVDFSLFSPDNLDIDYDIEIVPQKKSAATSAAINNIVMSFANNGGIPLDLAFELIEFEGKQQIIKKIRERTDIEAQLQSVKQQAEQAIAQAQQYAQVAEKQGKQIDEQQNEIWNQKLKVVKQMLVKEGEEVQDQTETGDEPKTAAEAWERLQAEIMAGEGQKTA